MALLGIHHKCEFTGTSDEQEKDLKDPDAPFQHCISRWFSFFVKFHKSFLITASLFLHPRPVDKHLIQNTPRGQNVNRKLFKIGRLSHVISLQIELVGGDMSRGSVSIMAMMSASGFFACAKYFPYSSKQIVLLCVQTKSLMLTLLRIVVSLISGHALKTFF